MGCDSLRCIVVDCWWALAAAVGHFFAVVWPILAGYAVLYAAGAAAFLINLRIKAGESGRLEVPWNSWAYMLARPVKYGMIKAKRAECGGSLEVARLYSGSVSDALSSTSICRIYASLFNMLLFVWPVLLLYFAVTCVVGSVVGTLVLGWGYVKPNLSKNSFLEGVPIWLSEYDGTFRQFLFTRPMLWELVAVGLGMAIWKWAVLVRFLAAMGKAVLCGLPILAFIGLVVWITRKVVTEREDRSTTVGALAEYAEARKEKFCKVVDIK